MPTLCLIICACAAFSAKDLTPLSDFRETGDADIALVRDGEALMPIVVDDEPRNVAAARELASVINAASGVRPIILRESKGQRASAVRALFVGDVAAVRDAGLSVPSDDPDAFRVVAKDGSIYFLGRSDYAVFDWCERQLGARCYWRDPDGDELSVPRCDAILAKSVDYSDGPVYSKRICGSCGNQRWARFAKSGSSHRGGVHVHAPHKWYQDESLVAEHPEVFALTRDCRRAASPLLCYGNPATLEYYERRIDDAIAGVRDSGGIVDVGRKVITVSPWDVAYDCTCEYCTALYDYSLGEYGYASPVVWGVFLKRLAAWAKERHPDYIISFLPYWTMCEVPQGLDLTGEGNCEAEVCIMPGIALMKGESIKANEERIIRDWTAVTGRKAILWHYTCWPAEFTVAPYLFGETVQRHFNDMKDSLDGCFICGGSEVPRLSLMYYVMMRCMWNPDVDVSAIYDGFAKRMFGPAAKPMRRLMELQERGWNRRWPSEDLSDGNIYGFSYPPWTVREMQKCIARAERLAATDKLYLRRVRRYAEIFADFFEEARYVYAGVSLKPLSFVRASSAPKVDGILDEDFWGLGEPRSFVLVGGIGFDAHPKHGTEVRAAHVDDGLVFAFTCDEPNVEGMPRNVAQGDDIKQDTLSVIFEVDGSCRHINIDAQGRVCAFVDNVPWSADGVEAAVRIGDGWWCAEVFVPFSAVGESAATAFATGGWRGNLVRWRPGLSRYDGEWSRLSTRRSPLNKDRNAFVPFCSAEGVRVK